MKEFDAVICDHCEIIIDTEHEKHSLMTDPWGKPTGERLCENCQERAYDRHQQSLMDGDHLVSDETLRLRNGQ